MSPKREAGMFKYSAERSTLSCTFGLKGLSPKITKNVTSLLAEEKRTVEEKCFRSATSLLAE
eukprot:977641-Amphidinium_carterae.2